MTYSSGLFFGCSIVLLSKIVVLLLVHPFARLNVNPLNVSISCSLVGLTGDIFLGRPFLIVRNANLIFRPAVALLAFSIFLR
jgi:hypothetical protein